MNYILSESFTCEQISLLIEDIKTTISTRQYLLDEHFKNVDITVEYYRKKQDEINTFVQMVVILTSAFEEVKLKETIQQS